MADYTDSPFSLICRRMGADVIYREMVSAEALVRGNEKTLKMAEFDKKERPIILQIFGRNPKIMAEAARILEEKFHPDGIDINMGCPARKIISNFNGASLMKDPKLAAKIIEAVKGAVAVPVSVKTRTGWTDEKEILKFSPIIEAAGADAIAIHGRTKSMGYSGKANWDIIGRAKEKLSIPVLLNGDIVDFSTFKQAMDISGADPTSLALRMKLRSDTVKLRGVNGVLIGRGALGNPWIFKHIKNKKDAPRQIFEIKKIILRHARAHLAHYGSEGMISFRKHAAAYFKGVEGAKRLRQELVKIGGLEDLERLLKGF